MYCKHYGRNSANWNGAVAAAFMLLTSWYLVWWGPLVVIGLWVVITCAFLLYGYVQAVRQKPI